MTHFNSPASAYMSSPILTVSEAALTTEAERILDEHGVSALGVTNANGKLIGVISRTDLLETSSAEVGETFRVAEGPVEGVMTSGVVAVAHDTPLAAVARRMLDEHVHRVFVEKDGAPVGVVSTRDLMRAVVDARVRTPAIEIATKKLVSVKPDDSIALAVDRLERANKHGLVVVEDDWPLGTFSQRDALDARARDPRTAVEDAMNQRILVLPPTMPLYRAAQQAIAMDVRRILLVDELVRGIVSSFDFARVVR